MKTNNINAGTITRTILLGIALVNQVLVALGYNTLPIDNELLTQAISVLFTAGVSVWSWWKNNSFTKAAREADSYKNDIKSGISARQERG